MRDTMAGMKLVMILAAAGVIFLAAGAARSQTMTQPATIRILLVGDSTVTAEAGWGAGFASCFSSRVQVINTARGGRSSKSFRDEGLWDAALSHDADYVLIQFGHNDQPGKGPDRETDPNTTYRENLRRYIAEARARGMKPVIVTSLVRRKFDAAGKIKSDLLPYVEAAKAVAAETAAPLLDLHARSIAFCEQLGQDGCREQLEPRKEDGAYDTTHLTEPGGKRIGALVAEELVKLAPELAEYFQPGDR